MKRIVLAVALFLPFAARGADELPAFCTSARNVLRVGVPRPYAPKVLDAAIEGDQDLKYAFRKAYEFAAEKCTSPAPQLDLQITAGNNYQMVEWLGSGQIDAAILTDMGVAIVRDGDGIPLYEIDTLDQPRYEPKVVAQQRVASAWVPVTSADPYRRFLFEVWSGLPATHRLVLADHLSATGFLEPLRRADAFLDEQNASEERREVFWRRWFDRADFTIECRSTQACFDQLVRRQFPAFPDRTTAVMFLGERALASEGLTTWGNGYEERLVITQAAAVRVLGGITRLDDNRSDLLSARSQKLDFFFDDDGENEYVPPQFRAMAQPDPILGFRTYGFSVEEVFQLLRQEQAIRATDDLALVLPGGGVKAAYQSTIIDSLYGEKYLRNDALPPANGPLKVRSVIGTSGGALLGYFVSQLRDARPNLANTLWKPGNQILRTGDVFSWTDLMRYVAINVAFAVYCFVLALFSARALATSRRTSPAYPHDVKVVPMWRGRLVIPLLLILFATPLVVRAIGGDDLKEHVPEFEGILFSVMTVLIMIIDQVLVRDPETPRETDDAHPKDHRALFILGGGLLLLTGRGVMQQQATFIAVFSMLFTLIVFGGLVVLDRSEKIGNRTARIVEAFLALVLTLLACTFVPASFHLMRIIAGGLLVVAVLLTGFYVGQPRKLRGVPFLATFSITLLIAAFSWPETLKRASGGMDAAIFTAVAADMDLGTFYALIGLLVLLAGAVRWAYCSDRAYRVVKPVDLLIALAVGIVHVFLTFAVIQTLGWLDIYVTPFELAGSFWIGLISSSIAVALIVYLLAAYGGARWEPLRQAIRHLVSMHPNGIYLQRRFARLIVVGAIALAWWNVILAPALYSNGRARGYLYRVVASFHGTVPRFEPATRFVAPTSVLNSNQARYFMFLPEGADCPPIPDRLMRKEWKVFRRGGARGEDGVAEMDEALALRVIFASGSPFPVFPAHHVGDEWLIDGGYASNIPIDAARTLNAKQLLIIHSANPIEEQTPSKLKEVPGSLIANLARMPGFLFARSQEVDRLSRKGVFVASLAPPADERPWPTLTDFKSSVVEKMLDAGQRHLKLRVGAIESWGEPSFQVTEEIVLQ